MGQFEVRMDILEQLAGCEKDIASEVAAISLNVSETLHRMTQDGVVSSSIRNRSKDAISSISECQSAINKMGTTLEECVREYQQTESKLLLLGLQQEWMESKIEKYLHTLQPAGITTLAGLCKLAEIGRESTTNEIEKENDYSVRDEAIDSLYDYAAGAGYIGALSSFVGRIVGGQISKDPNEEFDEDKWRSESVGTLKGGFSMMKMLSKWKSGNEELAKLAKYAPNWAKEEKIARLFGMTDAMGGTASTAGSWGARFAENVSKQDGILDDFSKGGSKTFFAWAGVVVDGAMNAYGNYEEYKDGEIGVERAIVETVTETAVDFAVDWGIGVAVTAALAATPIGAPVLLVGACTVGAKFLLDWGSEKLFGKDFTEVVSDTIVDVAAGTMEVAADVVNAVGEFVEEIGKAVGDAICKGTQKVVSGVGNAIKDGWESAKAGFSSIGQGFKSLLAW